MPTSNQRNTQCTNTQYPIPNTQKFWSDRKSRFTDILDPKKDTIKHDCFWLKKRYNKTRLFLSVRYTVIFQCQSDKKVLSVGYWVLSHLSWVLNIGYTVIFPMPSQAKKYKCWVLGIGYWVLGIGQFTVLFQYPVSQKHRLYQFFSNTQYPIPKIRGPTGKTALWLLVGRIYTIKIWRESRQTWREKLQTNSNWQIWQVFCFK